MSLSMLLKMTFPNLILMERCWHGLIWMEEGSFALPEQIHQGTINIMTNEQPVQHWVPHFSACDFVSRFFNTGSCHVEDPVTGSAHCSLVPFWSQRLGKKSLKAKQISKREGTLFCQDLDNEFVSVAGDSCTFFKGTMFIKS